MFKKFAWTFIALGVAFFILFFSFYKITIGAKPSWAAATLKNRIVLISTPTTAVTPTVTPIPKVEYYLVYPGLLPDHPLYKVKAARDRIRLWLTNGSLKQAELMLLFADKRIGAGKVLVEGNKVPLGITTFQKGEKYLDSAVSKAAVAKKEGKDISEISMKMKNASLKYEEILVDLESKISSEGKGEIDNLLKTLKDIQSKINSL